VQDQILQTFSATPYLWLVMLIGFMAASWVAQRWAHNTASPAMQYAGLGLYTLAEVVIFAPLLVIAGYYGGDHVIPTAGIMTGIIFLGLTAFAFVTKADFSFLRGILWLGTFAAFGFIIASIFLDFSLGLVFCSLMVTLASGWILYDTSNVLHHYRTDQHVGASLELFASLALLFWYVLRIVMIFASDD
jgi:FtsH-binding integral membrane protein